MSFPPTGRIDREPQLQITAKESGLFVMRLPRSFLRFHPPARNLASHVLRLTSQMYAI